MLKRDVLAAAMTLAFGAGAAFESARLPLGTVHNPGQGFFPWWTSVVSVLLGLILLVQALASRPGTLREGPGRTAKVAALLVVLGAYAFLLEPLGYLISTFLLVLFMLRATDPQRWSVALGMAAITAVGSYAVFAIWLSVPLPRGLFSG